MSAVDSMSLFQSKFQLVISSAHWLTIASKRVKYGDRSYSILPPGIWTNLFANKIWEQWGIVCAFPFKRANISENTDAKYCTFVAKCNECGTILKGPAYKKPSRNSDLIFSCTMTGNFATILHNKKRNLTGKQRREIASELLDGQKDACSWRYNESKRVMKFDDKIPPFIYSAAVLRKEEEALKRLALFKNEDPITNLQQAKYSIRPRVIREIGHDSFFVQYWSKEQKFLHKITMKNDPNSYVTFDATGSLCYISFPMESNFRTFFFIPKSLCYEKWELPNFSNVVGQA